jgi:hypothetical protein
MSFFLLNQYVITRFIRAQVNDFTDGKIQTFIFVASEYL